MAPVDESKNGHLVSVQTLDTDSRSSAESSAGPTSEQCTNRQNVSKLQNERISQVKPQSLFLKNELLTDGELSDFSDTEEDDEDDEFRHQIVLNGNQSDGGFPFYKYFKIS